jgi:hypothetical protein
MGKKQRFQAIRPLVDFVSRMSLYSPTVDRLNKTNASRWYRVFFETLDKFSSYEREFTFKGSWWQKRTMSSVIRRQTEALMNICRIAEDEKAPNRKEAQAYLAVMVAYLDSKENVSLKNYYAKNGLYRYALDKVLSLGQQDAGKMKEALKQLVKTRKWWVYETDTNYLHEIFMKMAQEFWAVRGSGWSRPYLLICKAALELVEEGKVSSTADAKTLNEMKEIVGKMEKAPLPDALPAAGKLGL